MNNTVSNNNPYNGIYFANEATRSYANAAAANPSIKAMNRATIADIASVTVSNDSLKIRTVETKKVTNKYTTVVNNSKDQIKREKVRNFHAIEDEINYLEVLRAFWLFAIPGPGPADWKHYKLYRELFQSSALNELLEKCKLVMEQNCPDSQKMEKICRLTAQTMQSMGRKFRKTLLMKFDYEPKALAQFCPEEIRSVCESLMQYRMNAAMYFELRKREVISSFVEEELFKDFFGEKTLNEIFEYFLYIIPTSEGPNFEKNLHVKIYKHLISKQFYSLPILADSNEIEECYSAIKKLENSTIEKLEDFINKANLPSDSKLELMIHLYISNEKYLWYVKTHCGKKVFAKYINEINSSLEKNNQKIIKAEEQLEAIVAQ